MRGKLRKLNKRIESDPRLKKAVDSIKPKRTFWGVMGIVVFFFFPELITYVWQPELISWAHQHTITEPLAIQRIFYAKLEKMFVDGISWFNIAMGVALLVWVWYPKQKEEE